MGGRNAEGSRKAAESIIFSPLISIFRTLRPRELAWSVATLAWLTWLFELPPRPSAWLVCLSGLPLGLVLSALLAQRRQEPWLAFLRATADVHALAGVLLYCLGLQFSSGHGISTDGVVYFSQLRSLVFDHDLNVAREFEVLNQPARPNHIVPVGLTLFWLPVYLIVATVDWLGRSMGAWPTPPDPTTLGLGLPYIRAALVTSFAFGAVGLFVLNAHLRREFGKALGFATTVLIFGATTVFWYMVYEASMTHAASFGLVAIFAVLVARWVPSGLTTRRAVIIGTVLGLAFLARPQEALFALFPAWLVMTGPGDLRERVGATWRLARWGFLGVLPWLVLELAHATILFMREEYAMVGQGGYLRPFDSRWVDTLFSSWHGFLSWTPVAYVAVIGTIVYLWRNWRWASCTLALLFLMAWLNGSTMDWSAGWAFGGRRFTSLLVMLAPGLAAIIDVALRRPVLLLAPAILVALVWNQLLMVQYTIGLLPKDQPIDFGQMVRQQADVHTRYPYFYPFAFPANVWFAWREGLPVNRYDRLGIEANRTTLDLALDRGADKFLLGGWDAPGGDDFGSCWWIGGVPATIALPLDLPAGKPIVVEITARTRADEPAMRAQIVLEVNGTPLGEFSASPDEPSTTRLTIPATRGGRPWRRGFNKIAFRYNGVSRVDPSDTRPPGALAQEVGSHVWPVAIYRIRINP
jgi:hypothetical protein